MHKMYTRYYDRIDSELSKTATALQAAAQNNSSVSLRTGNHIAPVSVPTYDPRAGEGADQVFGRAAPGASAISTQNYGDYINAVRSSRVGEKRNAAFVSESASFPRSHGGEAGLLPPRSASAASNATAVGKRCPTSSKVNTVYFSSNGTNGVPARSASHRSVDTQSPIKSLRAQFARVSAEADQALASPIGIRKLRGGWVQSSSSRNILQDTDRDGADAPPMQPNHHANQKSLLPVSNHPAKPRPRLQAVDNKVRRPLSSMMPRCARVRNRNAMASIALQIGSIPPRRRESSRLTPDHTSMRKRVACAIGS